MRCTDSRKQRNKVGMIYKNKKVQYTQESIYIVISEKASCKDQCIVGSSGSGATESYLE